MTSNIKKVPVVIIGGGLSGLYAAFLLEKKGISYVLLEARKRLGGRILAGKLLKNSSSNEESLSSIASFDLGPSWFWPEYQQQLASLVKELHLQTFAQFEDGEMMLERTANEPVARVQGYKSSPTSTRLAGGMTALIDALYSRLNPDCIITCEKVYKVSKSLHSIKIESIKSNDAISNNDSDRIKVYYTEQVLLALPPRLAEHSIVFEPELPADLTQQWHNTATWMAPHAKYIAVYDIPFWQAQGLSGSARSSQGPMVEIHDASIPNGHGALFGFIGVPAPVRQNVSEVVLKAHCREQFVRLFGAQAANPTVEYLKDWAQDKLTATTIDANSNGQHSVAPAARPISGVWSKCLTGIGSEWSLHFSGYLAGAIEATSLGIDNLPKFTSKVISDN